MKALKFSSFVVTATMLFTGFNMPEAKAKLNRTEVATVFGQGAGDSKQTIAYSNSNVLDSNVGAVGSGNLGRYEMSDSFSLANALGYVKQTKVIRRTVVTPRGVIRQTTLVTPRGVIRRTTVAPRRIIRRYRVIRYYY